MAAQCANPKLAEWLKEWMDQAKERNSKGYTVYKKAYESMVKCPIHFSHPSEAQQLSGLGPKLCDRLAAQMQAFCNANGIPMPAKGRTQKRGSALVETQQGEDDGLPQGESPPRKPRAQKKYVPKLRSGPYALILALATLDQEGSQALSKQDLIELAQPLCDSSFTAPPDPSKYFTAWNSMKTLESKELVCTRGYPAKKYYLSDEGWEVALRMKAAEEGLTSIPQPNQKRKPSTPLSSPPKRRQTPPTERSRHQIAVPILPKPLAVRASPVRRRPQSSSSASEVVNLLSSPEPAAIQKSSKCDDGEWVLNNSIPPAAEVNVASTCHSRINNSHFKEVLTDGSLVTDDAILLPAGSFEVNMVLDMREVRTTTDRDYISNELRKLNVTPVLKALPLGDILWVAKVNPAYTAALKGAQVADYDSNGSDVEIVLEHIIERKRLDDLLASIKDGRFHEQKFRLHKSGIKHVSYLIEECAISTERSDKYGPALESAIASMQVVNGFFVKQTNKLDDTIRYLARMTRTLKELYENKDIHVIAATSFESEGLAATVGRLRKLWPSRTFGMTFSAFAAMCDKSESMALKDVYMKMLMCTRGVTGDKAVEIQKIWKTPKAFVEAFEHRSGQGAKETMVSDQLGNAIPRKKVGKALSAKIAEVWAA